MHASPSKKGSRLEKKECALDGAYFTGSLLDICGLFSPLAYYNCTIIVVGCFVLFLTALLMGIKLVNDTICNHFMLFYRLMALFVVILCSSIGMI